MRARLIPDTVRGRLAAAMALLCLAVLAATSGVVYVAARRALLQNLDDALLAIARTEIASSIDEPHGAHVHQAAPEALQLPVGEGYEKLAQIRSEDGSVVAQTANLIGAPALETDPSFERHVLEGGASFADLRHGGQRWRALYYPLPSSGPRLVAIVALPRRPLDRSLDALAFALAVSLALACTASVFGAARIARRLTRPLEQIAEAARAVGKGNLTVRIPDGVPDAELRAVANALNEMLTRLEAAFEAERQAVDSQRRFVADASHELRTPLANLRGTVEVALRRERTATDYRETLAASLAEIDRLSRLVADLLTLSRADAGALPVRRGACDLSQIAGDAVRACAARAGERAIAVSLAAEGPLPLEADPDRLREVVDNLLDNALRHAPAGSAVRVSAARADGGVCLRVEDTGPGLAPGALAHIFDRFWRADAARAREAGGAGLGLAIVKAITEAHGGRVGAQSKPGDGLCVSVWLPIEAGPSGREALSQPSSGFAGGLLRA